MATRRSAACSLAFCVTARRASALATAIPTSSANRCSRGSVEAASPPSRRAALELGLEEVEVDLAVLVVVVTLVVRRRSSLVERVIEGSTNET